MHDRIEEKQIPQMLHFNYWFRMELLKYYITVIGDDSVTYATVCGM